MYNLSFVKLMSKKSEREKKENKDREAMRKRTVECKLSTSCENIRHSSYIDFYKNVKFNIKKFI